MLHSERYDNEVKDTRAAFRDFAAGFWTALPCIVQSFDSARMVISAQPAIKIWNRDKNGNIGYLTIPVIEDIPIMFQGGGGFTLTFPIAPGDECLVIFADRCIDGWWSSGQLSTPSEIRMHDLSDGFALVGLRSAPNAFAVADHPRLTSNDSMTYVEMSGGGQITLVAPTKIHMTTPLLEVTGDVVAGTISLKNHVHSGVQSGGSDTGTPVP